VAAKILLTIALLASPIAAFGVDISPVGTGITLGTVGANVSAGASLLNYLGAAYKLGVVAVAALAVLAIAWGAVEVMSESFFKKADGRQRIWNAVLGLLLALGSVVILQTISKSFVAGDPLGSLANLGETVDQAVGSAGGLGSGTAGSNNRPTTGTGGGTTIDNPGGGVSQITTFGGPGDIRTENGYALSRQGYDGMLGDYVETDQFGTKWYYAVDSNGNRIPFSGGSSNGFVGYNETGAVGGTLLRNVNPGSDLYAAYPLNGHSIAGLPTNMTNSALSGRSIVVRTNNGSEVVMQIIDRGPVSGTKLDVSSAAANLIQQGGGISSITLR
jgi:hypothetical protein